MKKSKKKQLIMTMLFQAANLWQKKCNDTASGLTLRQFMLLSAIKNSEYQFISFAGLSKIFGGTRQNIKQLVDALVKKEYLSCSPSETDKRETLVCLTEKAQKYLEDETSAENFVQAALKGVGEKSLDGTLDCLDMIIENLSEK